MKLKKQLTVPNKEFRDLYYFNKVDVLEENFKRECLDYPTQEDCLVCCNWLFINRFFHSLINSKNIYKVINERLNYEIKILPNNYF